MSPFTDCSSQDPLDVHRAMQRVMLNANGVRVQDSSSSVITCFARYPQGILLALSALGRFVIQRKNVMIIWLFFVPMSSGLY